MHIFGVFGGASFLSKKIGSGIFYLFTAGGFAIGWIVDIFLIATGKMPGLEKPHSVTLGHPQQTKVEQQKFHQLSEIPSIISQSEQPTSEKIQTKESDFVLNISGDYCTIYSNGKEIFDGDIVTKRENYILADGWKRDKQAIAFFTNNELISIRLCEDLIEGAAILPSGVAFAFVDSDNVIIFSESGTKSKKFGYGSASEKSRIITDELCAYADDTGDSVVLKCFLFDTQTSWSKTIKYGISTDLEVIYAEPSLMYSGGMIFVIFQNGDRYAFFKDGEKVKDIKADASEKKPVKNNQIVVDDTPLDYSFSVKIKSETEEDHGNESREPVMLPHLPFTPNDNDPAPTAKQLNYLHDLRILVPVGISKYDASALISRATDGDFECPTPDMVATADGLGVEYSAFIGKDAMFEHIVYSCGHEKRAALYAYCVDCSLKNMQISNMFSSPRLKIYFDFAVIVKNDNGLLKSLSERLPSDFQQPNKNTNIYKACRDYLLAH